jgi:outer membrane protein OmpA-like peptidoglycan-associated protein
VQPIVGRLPAAGRRALPAIAIVAALSGAAHADPTSGIDAALFRSSYDTGGLFALEGARLMPAHDLSFKLLLSYARSPIKLNVPGIGTDSRILDYLVTLDLAFGLSLSDRWSLGFDVAGYRTATGPGYGVRGRYSPSSPTGVSPPSTGLISLRPLSNIDPSADPNDASSYLGDDLAGPLDARVGVKYQVFAGEHLAVAAIGSVFLPFGEEEMLLGDRSLVFEPKLAAELRADRVHATRLLANLAVRFRQRAVLQAYDSMAAGATTDDAKVLLDVGSELVAGLGGSYEISPRVVAAIEAQGFFTLPQSLDYGTCDLYDGRPCNQLLASDYMPGVKRGDVTGLATAGLSIRFDADVTGSVMVGAGAGGVRADELRVTTGVMWSPQPAGTASVGRGDRDGDGIPDAVDNCPDDPEDKDGFQDEDGCPDPDNDGDGIPDVDDKCPNEAEDKDGFQDADGCPERDNDNDGIPDAADKCPDQPEDKDGFQDDDGCPDPDNDGDGIPDTVDKCPNDPETFNGFEDADGCPDVRGASGPEEKPDRIDLKGNQISFGAGKASTQLTPAGKQVLGEVAALIKNRRLAIRVEVHVALDTKSANAGQIVAAKKRGKQLAAKRAQVILDYLVSQGVPANAVQAVGLGADRPLGAASPADPINERVDFIKAQQGVP